MSLQETRPKKSGLAIAVIALVTAVVLVIVVALAWLLVSLSRVHSDDTPIIPPDHCLATSGEYTGVMTPEQAGNAAIITGEAIRRNLAARASTVALVTAWQESSLRNLDYGDRDSLGLFQQRPSQGWGKPAQIMDPWYSSGKFYDALVKLKHWQTDDINDVAQEVQHSGHPDAYRQHESAGRAWSSALTGNTVAAIRCVLNNGSGGGGDELTALLAKVWGKKLTVTTDGDTITIDAPDVSTSWAAAQMSMAQLASYGFTSVQVGDWYLQLQPIVLADWVNLRLATTPLPSAGELPSPISNQQVIITLLPPQ